MMHQNTAIELWAGIECTVNRVGDQYFDQLERNGHATRIEDLDLFASLGIRAIRYPVLWERVAPKSLAQADWAWSDQRLERLRLLGIRPIVGLIHHGSGPDHTSLLDPAFPEKLAAFAQAVAHRYSWVLDYTPVNEPLTTARFSGLYGLWYPHQQDHQSFLRSLLNQCRATILAMQAIRQINPQARLVQTEDLGKTFSTPRLAYQAEFENQRRWLSFDLLCGQLDRTHPLWSYFLTHGISVADLEWFLEHPCPPDVMGINRYVTSDRFLDEHVEHYPSETHGGNEQEPYADVEAVRVCAEGIYDLGLLLQEVWDRYHRPIAITEVHLGCTREEQLRWLQETWDAVQRLRVAGVDMRAVTAWSLLGAYDWNSLLTRADGHYEPGVFDLRAPQPRATALANMLRHLAEGTSYTHPLLEISGWWRRTDRLIYPPVECTMPGCTPSQSNLSCHFSQVTTTAPLLIIGATGTLGQAFARLCEVRGIPYRLLSRREMDITDRQSIEQVLTALKPWAVINTAGYVRVDEAEREPHLCRRVNADGAVLLAEACLQHDASFVTFSSDLVFDGDRTEPYLESCDVSPLNVYGHSKAIAERWVLQAHPCSLVIRTSAFFSPWDDYNFLTIVRRTLSAGQPFHAAMDTIVSPTYVPDLVNVTLDLLIDGECGIWHLANVGAVSWAELADHVAYQSHLDTDLLQHCSSCELNWIALRPSYSVLGSERGMLLPTLGQAIDRYLSDCY